MSKTGLVTCQRNHVNEVFYSDMSKIVIVPYVKRKKKP